MVWLEGISTSNSCRKRNKKERQKELSQPFLNGRRNSAHTRLPWTCHVQTTAGDEGDPTLSLLVQYERRQYLLFVVSYHSEVVTRTSFYDDAMLLVRWRSKTNSTLIFAPYSWLTGWKYSWIKHSFGHYFLPSRCTRQRLLHNILYPKFIGRLPISLDLFGRVEFV